MNEASKSARRRGVQVIARAAEILRALDGYPQGLSLGVIAQRVALPRSTVQRIVGALAEERFVIAATPNARVRLGPGLVPLGTAAKSDFDAVVRPYLQRLSSETGETVDLAMLDGKKLLFIDQILGNTSGLVVVSGIGRAFPPHACANGKVLLAQLSEAEVSEAVMLPLSRNTDKTITSIAALNVALAKIRKEGIAYDLQEHNDGVCAVATFINEPFQRGLAISIPVPSSRFYGRQQELTTSLLRYTRQIEEALGSSSAPAA